MPETQKHLSEPLLRRRRNFSRLQRIGEWRRRRSLKDRIFNFVDKSLDYLCTPFDGMLISTNMSKNLFKAELPGTIEPIFLEFSESSRIPDLHHKLSMLSSIDIRNLAQLPLSLTHLSLPSFSLSKITLRIAQF